jgi:iron complex transport system substrate-binding protein
MMATPPRIVSLLPSSTEIVCALGLEEALVGISHACDYPASVAARPRLSRPKIDIHTDSSTIDREVRTLLRDGLSIYQIDIERLRTLQPDLIITQDQCEVCAVPYADVIEAARQALGSHVEIISLRPTMLQDIWEDIRRVGVATGREHQADAVLEALFARVKTIMGESVMVRTAPRVAVIEWIDPLILGGNWMPELIRLAGGHDGLCRMGEHSIAVDWQTVQDYAPQVLAVIPCGYKLEQTLAELSTLQRLPEWDATPAVRQGRVYAVDGNDYFNRPGPRIVDSLEILAGLIHPNLFGAYLPEAGKAYQQIA